MSISLFFSPPCLRGCHPHSGNRHFPVVLFSSPASSSLFDGLSEAQICSRADIVVKTYHVSLFPLGHRIKLDDLNPSVSAPCGFLQTPTSCLNAFAHPGSSTWAVLSPSLSLGVAGGIFLNLQDSIQRSLSLCSLPFKMDLNSSSMYPTPLWRWSVPLLLL